MTWSYFHSNLAMMRETKASVDLVVWGGEFCSLLLKAYPGTRLLLRETSLDLPAETIGKRNPNEIEKCWNDSFVSPRRLGVTRPLASMVERLLTMHFLPPSLERDLLC